MGSSNIDQILTNEKSEKLVTSCNILSSTKNMSDHNAVTATFDFNTAKKK